MSLIIKLLITAVLVIVIFIIKPIMTWLDLSSMTLTDMSAVGSFIGGVLGTGLVLIGTIIAFCTYRKQVKAQEKDKIESRFFELLKLHQENVNALKSLDGNVFHIYIRMIRTFQQAISEYNVKEKKNWDKRKVLKLAYLYFFYGWDELTEDRLKGVDISKGEVDALKAYFQKQGYEYTPSYKDFGIYFRQLYQTVSYIDSKKILSYHEKYEYIKTLRARINVEEQYLLFLNSLVASGLNWELGPSDENKKFITKYNLIKNIPNGFEGVEGIHFYEEYPNVLYEFEANDKTRCKKRAKLEKKYS